MKARPPDGLWRLVRRLARLGLGVALAAGSTACLTAEPGAVVEEGSDVAAGALVDAGTGPDSGRPRCPAGMALVPPGAGVATDFCIDRYEAATVALGPDGGTELHPFDRPVDGLSVRAVVPASGQKPQAYISATQARAACANAGKRLCSAAQWLHACRGPHDTVYPYGNTYQKGACNEGRATNPVNDCFGTGAGVYTYANMNSPCCVGKPNTVAVGGTFAACQSGYGVFDLHGNLDEWVDETTAEGHGVFRGGFFVDAKLNGAGCGYRTTAHLPTYHDYSLGFRCCGVAK